jgi:thiamine biosynthesis protein ThiS
LFGGYLLKITINGVDCEVQDNLTLQDLIGMRKLKIENLIVDVNGEIVKGNWEKVHLNPDDSIELVQMVFGG